MIQISNLNNIVIIGSSIIDLTIYSKKFPSAGESIVASSMMVQIGGKASNQAIGASRLGATPWLITKLGTDAWAANAISLWKQEGVRTDFVTFHPSEMTGIGVAFVAANGENWTLSSLNSNRYLSPADIEAASDLIRYSKVLTLHLNSSPETIFYSLKLAKLNNVLTILNASPIETIQEIIFSMVDILVVNQIEASQLSGYDIINDETAFAVARGLIKRGAKIVIISLGGDGLILSTPAQEKKYEAFPVSVVDSVGAGDALIAGLAVALAEGQELFDAVYFANAVGALSVNSRGNWQGIPSRSDVDRFIENQLKSKID